MKYLKTLGLILIIQIIIILLASTLSYFDIINNTINNIIKLLSVLSSSFIGGIYIGNKSTEKGYLEGIKIGAPLSITMIIISIFLFKNNINVWKILYYISILLLTVIGSIIGINKKEKHN